MMNRPHVLLVDNDPYDAELAWDVLTGLKVAVTVMRGGPEALAALGAGAHAPDLVVLDLHMPQLTGFDVLAQVRATARWAGVPVVLLSSSDDARDRARGAQVGAVEYHVKPSGYDALEAVLRGVLCRLLPGTGALAAGL